ncbi:HAMP domain-containing sensor histidine kinase [uncultured Rhizobium sp.]|uniref:sensor histidine kinase n=1 Tax=unclassified Neorhizobium TaxID=2629175 RepID=UPI002D8106F8|nr:HAMP domain-containing sensor histidine kinase [uncultured Rhizobium sp.]
MRGGSFFKSTAARLAIIYICLFVVSYLGANVIAYQMVLAYLDGRLNVNVMERYREIETAYQARGLPGAVDMINSHGPATRGQETIYTLRNPAGSLIAGNTSLDGVPDGYSVLKPQDQHDNDTNYKLFRGQIGDSVLIVGISYGDTDQLARIVLMSFGWTTAIVFAVGLGGAAVLSYRTRRRISVLSKTAHAIGHGELSKRLPVSARMDEIDVLSTQVNVALTRLETSVSALKQVTIDIAHDLKTPIGRTFLMLDDALQSADLEQMQNAVSTALVELGDIAKTFDALLRIAQIESRSRLAHFAAVDLSVVAKDICETYEAIVQDDGYQLCWHEEPADTKIEGDPDLLRQLLANLLSNAMRHTPKGSRIDVSVIRQRDSIILSVQDNGPGIPEQESSRVFDRFYRLEKSRTTAGSGLGLSLAKAICDLHDAKIQLLENHPGLKVIMTFEPHVN